MAPLPWRSPIARRVALCRLLQYLNNYHESKRNEPTFNDSRTIAAFLKKHPDPYRG